MSRCWGMISEDYAVCDIHQEEAKTDMTGPLGSCPFTPVTHVSTDSRLKLSQPLMQLITVQI